MIFWSFIVFSIWDINNYFCFDIALLFKWFMSFIERETQQFTLKFREIFPWREIGLKAHWMKSEEKPFFCQIYGIFFRENGTCCDWQAFFYFLRVWRFLNQRLSLITIFYEYGLNIRDLLMQAMLYSQSSYLNFEVYETGSLKDLIK